MSEAMKPSPGPWIAAQYSAKRFGLGTAGDGAWMYLQTIYQNAGHPEMRANARLIAEAGTVFHETQLSPRQLVAQRDELLAALRTLHTRLSDRADVGAYVYEAYDSFYQALVHDAIAKCEVKP